MSRRPICCKGNPEVASPYSGARPERWPRVTERLVAAHPLTADELVQVVLAAWDSIFASRFGTSGLRIGEDIFPGPQTMGFLLHEIIAADLEHRHPESWAGAKRAGEKDLNYLPDPTFSVEIKTSSHPRQIFGNRSFAQKPSARKKGKSGYYLAVNFEKWPKDGSRPRIRRIRFGWLDEEDWIGQVAPSGQQAHLSAEADQGKLKPLYDLSGKRDPWFASAKTRSSRRPATWM